MTSNRRTTVLLAAAAVGALAASGLVHADAASADTGSDPVSGATSSVGSAVGSAVGRIRATPTPKLKLPVTKPNLLMVTVDDMSADDMKYLPTVRKLIGGGNGTTFSNAIAPTPICVPSRASLLTGQYAFNHGARTISGPHGGFKSFDNSGTVATALQAAGYRTMMVGKFLNGYGEGGTRRTVPKGWNQWRATVDPSTYNYERPQFNVNGKIVKPGVYSTTEITRQAKTGLSAMRKSGKPWFGWVNYVAPHNGGPEGVGDPGRKFRGTDAAIGVPVPAKQDRGAYRNVQIPRKPDLFPTNRSEFATGSPARHVFSGLQKRALRIEYERRIESLRSVDRNVASLVRSLQAHGELSKTLIIFNSDNGYSTGYHNINGKLWHYNELLRIPMLMRGPGVPKGRTVGTTVTEPDIGATLMAAGGALPQRVVDGVPILPRLNLP
ncbi:MAG: sulfatase-like hydrolase/transferase, partial [Nocardioides sp.]|nr:sulfatase-like hydrolase/transferase [Nocardioides sp.]